MGKINKLSPYEAQKIAAGEVIERPANVVKELLENSLDADSSSISLIIEDGGKHLISVTDNGCGMSSEDARLSIAHHATSKIKTIDDLEHITTFGFRGEALSSIAAVAKLTLTTQERTSLEGITLTIEEGSICKETASASLAGTSIAVHDLFYNVPARKKFLKTKETETRAIMQLFQAVCLAHIAVHFKLISDSKLVYNCPAVTKLEDRITQLFDVALNNSLIPLNLTEKGNICISGAITHHQHYRYDRNQIFLFVNRRWVKNYKLTSAILKGYANVLPPQKYPSAFVFVTLAPYEVDINTHPRKEEVQFLHPRAVEQLVTQAVFDTLEKSVLASRAQPTTMPSFFSDQQEKKPQPTIPSVFPPGTTIQLPNVQANRPNGFTNEQTTISLEMASLKPKNYTFLGYLQKTFMLIEKEEGLLMIDAHAAHERILYEQFGHRFQEIPIVALIFPHIIKLSPGDMNVLRPHLGIFEQHAIQVEIFGEQELRVNATPVSLQKVNLDDLFRQVVGWINEHQTIEQSLFFKSISEKLRALMACKAAVKAGDNLSVQEMQQLIDTLEKTGNRLTCPHGRPTSWLISSYELEKKFKRT